MRGAKLLSRRILPRLSFAVAALSLAACAEAGGENAPGDGLESDADVDAGADDGALIQVDAAGSDAPPSAPGGASVALIAPEAVVVARGHATMVSVILDRAAGDDG